MITMTTPPTVGVSLPAETHVEQSRPDRNSVFQIIREQLSDILEIEPARVTESSSFVEDLEADSLASRRPRRGAIRTDRRISN